MKMTNEIIVGIVAIIVIIYFYTKKNNNVMTETSSASSLTDVEKTILKKFNDYVSQIILTYNLSINKNMVFAVIETESGSNVYKKNNEIKGFTGDYGYMQITFIAYQDTLQNYKNIYNYSFNDVKENSSVNILTGSLYLNLCYKQAIKEVGYNETAIKLTFKKYNAGIGTKLDSTKSNSYMEKTYNNYLRFKNAK
jgi:soluble lytic murein transglycosylase-like protein